MNQILLTDDFNNNNNKKNNKEKIPKTSNPIDIRKIISFFAIVIIVFGVALGGIYGYKIFKNKKGETVQASKPELSVTQTEDSAEVTITASSSVGIDRIIYSWNGGQEIVEELNGRTSQEENIEAPETENVLKVKVIDVNGEEIETEQNITITGENHTTEIATGENHTTETATGENHTTETATGEKPKIETAIVENGKLKIVATSEVPMEYISYKWNDEQETKIEAETEDSKTIETIIDVKRGKNEIVITAVNRDNGKKVENKVFNGVNNPIIEVSKDGSKLYMKISHDIGIKKIEFKVNGKDYVYDENARVYEPDKKEIEYYFNLKEGENIVIITATSTEDTQAEYKGKCNYTAGE